MITIAQEVIQATQLTYKFEGLSVRRGLDGRLSATTTFKVFNENGLYLKNAEIIYTGKEFDRFAVEFQSWVWLYQELATSLSIDARDIDPNTDLEFVSQSLFPAQITSIAPI